jgi:hypothetical protein
MVNVLLLGQPGVAKHASPWRSNAGRANLLTSNHSVGQRVTVFCDRGFFLLRCCVAAAPYVCFVAPQGCRINIGGANSQELSALILHCRRRGGEHCMNKWMILLDFYLALQLPLGILIGDFCAAGEDPPRIAFPNRWSS